MIRLEVPGTPIGGEDAREKAWVSQIAAAANLSSITLTFTLAQGRTVDLDNLVRPAMRGLQQAGLFGRGYPSLECLTAVKRSGATEGLSVEAGQPGCPLSPLLQAQMSDLAVGDRWEAWKDRWSRVVKQAWTSPPVTGPAFICIEVATTRSLIDLMKPIIDGLEAYLGRCPRGRLQFCPNDHLIHWMQIRRVANPAAAVSVQAGLL